MTKWFNEVMQYSFEELTTCCTLIIPRSHIDICQMLEISQMNVNHVAKITPRGKSF